MVVSRLVAASAAAAVMLVSACQSTSETASANASGNATREATRSLTGGAAGEAVGVEARPARPADRLELSGLSLDPGDGWIGRDPASRMRAAEFVLKGSGGAGDAGLVVFYFGPGSAGSIQANVDRWCSHFEQPDGRASKDVMNMTAHQVNGLNVHTVDLGGTYVAPTRPGAEERHHRPGQHMLAAIVETDAGPYYLRLLGPSATVERWRASFDAMIAGLEPAAVMAAADEGLGHP